MLSTGKRSTDGQPSLSRRTSLRAAVAEAAVRIFVLVLSPMLAAVWPVPGRPGVQPPSREAPALDLRDLPSEATRRETASGVAFRSDRERLTSSSGQPVRVTWSVPPSWQEMNSIASSEADLDRILRLPAVTSRDGSSTGIVSTRFVGRRGRCPRCGVSQIILESETRRCAVLG